MKADPVNETYLDNSLDMSAIEAPIRSGAVKSCYPTALLLKKEKYDRLELSIHLENIVSG